jgi:hypothetical protein
MVSLEFAAVIQRASAREYPARPMAIDRESRFDLSGAHHSQSLRLSQVVCRTYEAASDMPWRRFARRGVMIAALALYP